MTINDVFTAPEAAALWGLEKNTVKQACVDSAKGVRKNPFLPGEYRKSGRIWLITRAGMERVYGPQKIKILADALGEKEEEK